MSDNEIKPYMDRVQEFITNPLAIQSAAVEHVEQIYDGTIRIIDATNPFPTLMGINAANVATAAQSYLPVLRKQYPALATSFDDLHHHMSDKHYLNLYSTPATQKVRCLISYTELMARAVPQPDGSRLLTIRRTSWTEVDGVRFSLLYPVHIRISQNNIITVRYDLTDEHPLHRITSDVAYWTLRKPTGQEQTAFFQIELDMVQTTIKSVVFDINPSTGINKRIAFNDSYCFTRVWFKRANSTVWTEMGTTHSEMTFASNRPTAVLKVTEGEVRVNIPNIYFEQSMVSGTLRVEVYSSKGEIFLNSTGRTFNNFTNDWGRENVEPTTRAEAALMQLPSKNFYFSAIAAGGTNAIDFETAKQRVINDSFGDRQTPITSDQIIASGQNMGFTIKSRVDSATNRQFLATKPLPPSRDRVLITPGSATMETVLATTSALKTSPWVADNGDRITVTPDVLWKVNSGIIEMVPAQELVDVLALETDAKVNAINEANYLFSPFHYVLDSSGERFEVRPYNLEMPSAYVDRFIGSNETTGMTVEVASVSLVPNGAGWDLLVSTLANTAWKEQDASYKHAQLSFNAPGIGGLAAVNGTYLGAGDNGEDVFSFNLASGFDIDSNHKLSLLTFHASSSSRSEVFVDLEQIFNLIFISSAPLSANAVPTNMDAMIVTAELPVRKMAVFGQKVSATFGVYLANLWSSSRTLSSGVEYLTYDEDIYDTYSADVLEINPDNGTTVWFNDQGEPTVRVLHEAGTQRLDASGNPILLHPKGSQILSSGRPIPVSKDTLQRQFDLLLLEGSYYFASDASTVEYRQEMAEVLSNYITKDLPQLANSTLDKTEIFFYPKVTMGNINVLVDAGTIAQIQSAQVLTVRLGVRATVLSNFQLLEVINRLTVETIDNYFDNEVLTISDLTEELRRAYTEDVLSISVTGLGGQIRADAITLLNANERCSLKKRVVVLESGEFTVREAITIDIFEHTSKQ